jgi:DNA-binding CsgD family transcriptional regulator/tetratricopeptide (TPR) repeat protein
MDAKDASSVATRARLALVWRQIGDGDLDAAAATASHLLFPTPTAEVRAEAGFAVGVMLQRVGRLAEARERFLTSAALTLDPAREACFVAHASAAEFLAGDLTAARRTANRARELAASPPAVVDGAAGELPDGGAEALALAQLAAVSQAEGDPHEARRLAEAAVRAESATGAPIGGRRAHIALAGALMDLDRLEEADRALTICIAESEADHDPATAAYARGVRAIARFLHGQWDAALGDAHDTIAGADASGMYTVRPWGQGVAACVCALRGDAAAARALVADGGAKRLGAFGGPGEEWILIARAAVAPDDAHRYAAFGEAWRRIQSHPWLVAWRPLAPAVVRSALACGDVDLARAVTESAQEGARRSGSVASAQAAALHCAGLVTGDLDAIVESARLLRGAGRPFVHGQTALDAARACVLSGRKDLAITLLRDAMEEFHEVRAARSLAAAGQLLAYCGGTVPAPRRPARDPFERLTRSERLVADLAARGLTNPQIARELFLSPRTVQAHLSSVYAKLAIGSRVQLAGLVAVVADSGATEANI